MSGLIQATEFLKKGINKSKDTKNAIIFMAESDEMISRKIKQIAKKEMEEVINKKPEKLYFDPKEIEPIVLKNRENKVVPNNKFKEKLKIRQQKKLEEEGKIVQMEPRKNKERDIG